MTRGEDSATAGGTTFVRGRFEARFADEDGARAAARDVRATAFVVDVLPDGASWLLVGRHRLAFPADERDRYVSRLTLIAARHHGAFIRFVEEPLQASAGPTD